MVSDNVFSNINHRRFRLILPVTLVVVVIAVASQLSSCASPGYYWQAASGHLALMHDRQPVDTAIEQGSVDEATTARLKLSQDILAFAIGELGLPDNGSYSEFVLTGQDAVVWNVIAAPEFSLQAKQWCFPVAGCVPYRGYFKKSSAEKFAVKMQDRGLEVTVSPATAYSTLGWFDDPLLDTMWNRSDTQFAAFIFHELAHQELYIKDDTRFNESYASFVETVGVKLWLQKQGKQENFDEWLAIGAAERDFSGLLEATRDELRNIYQSGENPGEMRTQKNSAFENMQESYEHLVRGEWGGKDYFGNWFSKPPNNARFALLDSYHGGNCAFAGLFAESGQNIREFHTLAREKSRLPTEDRHAWLEQTCPVIAPEEEL